jgi:mannose-6-phosphate isomerase-like protein (cupin superfamily)
VARGLFIQGQTEGCALEVHGLNRVGEGYASDGLVDTVYVIASGYGVLRWGEMALECTAGDVLFVPGGPAHCFERLDGEIKVWRISAGRSPAATGGRD